MTDFHASTPVDSLLLVRQVQLALLLSESQVPFVIVGGTARLVRGSTRTPADLDLVVTRMEAGLLQSALQRFAVPTRQGWPVDVSPWRVVTSWSPVDVFLEDDLPAWHPTKIDRTTLRVADE